MPPLSQPLMVGLVSRGYRAPRVRQA